METLQPTQNRMFDLDNLDSRVLKFAANASTERKHTGRATVDRQTRPWSFRASIALIVGYFRQSFGSASLGDYDHSIGHRSSPEN